MELHRGRYIGSYAAWLRRLADQYRPRMSDWPDITTATRLAHAQRGEHAVDPRAPATPGSLPSFQEMHYEIRRLGSEAAAFGELVQALQSRLSGTAIGVLVELASRGGDYQRSSCDHPPPQAICQNLGAGGSSRGLGGGVFLPGVGGRVFLPGVRGGCSYRGSGGGVWPGVRGASSQGEGGGGVGLGSLSWWNQSWFYNPL